MNQEIKALAGKKYEIVDKPIEANINDKGKYHDLILALKNLDRTKSIKLSPQDLTELGIDIMSPKSLKSFKASINQTSRKVRVKVGCVVTGGVLHVYTR